MTTTAAKPAPVYTVFVRVRYVDSTEIWTGENFAKALQVAVDQIGTDTVRPLDHTATVALRAAGTPVSAWLSTDADGDERIVFITR